MDFDVQDFGLLGVHAMLGAGEDAQVGHLLARQAVAGQHPLDGLLDHALGVLALEDLALVRCLMPPGWPVCQ